MNKKTVMIILFCLMASFISKVDASSCLAPKSEHEYYLPYQKNLLNPYHIELDLAVNAVIGQNRVNNKTCIYGGAGVDVSNYILSVNAPNAFFVSRYDWKNIDEL